MSRPLVLVCMLVALVGCANQAQKSSESTAASAAESSTQDRGAPAGSEG